MPSVQDVKVALIRDLSLVGPDGLDRASQPSLFDRIEWFRRTWEHCPPGKAPLIAHAQSGSQAAWLFLAAQPGGHAVALASWYTLAFRPVFVGSPDMPTQRDLLGHIAGVLRGDVSIAALSHVPADCAALIADAFRSRGWAAFRTPDTANWTLDVASKNFAEYWAGRPGQLRSTVKRKRAKAALDIAIHDAFDDAVWAEYDDVYTDSWKPEEGSIAFLRATAASKGSSGRLRLGIARIDGRAVAAQLWTVEDGTAIIHKLAHRSGLDAVSPGTLLTHAMFEHVIDRDRVARIDFGTGDDRYKADWMDTRTMLERVDLYDLRSPRGLIGAGKRVAARALGR